jgi:uncharacterized membrane protein YdjX (TVP38/TMEM64 family)
MTGRERKKLLVGYLVMVLLVITLYCLFRHRLWGLLSAVPVTAQKLSLALLPGLAIFTLLFALTVFLSAPTNPLFYLAAGYLYGALPGTFVSIVATTLGSLAAYLFFSSTISVPQSKGLQSMEPGKLLLLLLLLRSSPWFPGPLINVFCGATRVRPALFVASCMLGSMPLASVYTLAASRLHGPLDVSLLRAPEIRVALLMMGGLSLVGLLKPLRLVASHLRSVPPTRPEGTERA